MLRLFALSLLALAACEGAEAKPAPATAQKASADQANADHDLCVAIIQHSRTCTDQYIPALVDARAAADHPAGIKAEVTTNRDGVIAQAKQEWSTDSTDANIEAMCQRPMPNADAQRDSATACQAQTDCAAFAQCIVPIQAVAWH
ncbi:MAG: hypothetical protein ABI678_06155 [Kofleriaceae bacterium]